MKESKEWSVWEWNKNSGKNVCFVVWNKLCLLKSDWLYISCYLHENLFQMLFLPRFLSNLTQFKSIWSAVLLVFKVYLVEFAIFFKFAFFIARTHLFAKLFYPNVLLWFIGEKLEVFFSPSDFNMKSIKMDFPLQMWHPKRCVYKSKRNSEIVPAMILI